MAKFYEYRLPRYGEFKPRVNSKNTDDLDIGEFKPRLKSKNTGYLDTGEFKPGLKSKNTITSILESSNQGCCPKVKISHRTTPKLHTSDSIVKVR